MATDRVETSISDAPHYHVGHATMPMGFWVLGGIAVIAALYAVRYDPMFMVRWCGYVLAGLAIECVYLFLTTGKPALRSGGSALTAAILVMSIPADMPVRPVLYALVLAIVLARMPIARNALHLNPALVGRLFLMIAYSEQIVRWRLPGMDLDAVTTATPIELFHAEEFTLSLKSLLLGPIGGSWEDFYEMVPGAPGEAFTPAVIIIGLILYWRGMVAWRTGMAFLAAFAVTCAGLREPVLFNLLSGGVIFASVFIAGDPKTTPVSKGAQFAGGIIAGVSNALIRHYTYYSEGLAYSFLILCLVTPTLDRIAFWLRSQTLIRRRARLLRTVS